MLATEDDSPGSETTIALREPTLSLQDPVDAQQHLCNAISRLTKDAQDDVTRLRALLVFEKSGHHIVQRLLARYVEGDAQLRLLERKYWQAVVRLNRAFSKIYEQLLPPFGTISLKSGKDLVATALVHLFHHRQVEFLLRFLRYKKRNSGLWRELNATYALAQDQGLTTLSVTLGQIEGTERRATTLERQYLRILLLDWLNDGQLSPREAVWASTWTRRWCRELTLQSSPSECANGAAPKGFVLDLGGSAGLVRSSAEPAGNLLYLDPTPLLSIFEEQIAALRETRQQTRAAVQDRHNEQVALLKRLRILMAPSSIRIERRGDRRPVALPTQAVVGLAAILRVSRWALRAGAESNPGASIVPEGDTIEAFSGLTRRGHLGGVGGADRELGTVVGDVAAEPQIWQVKDRSESGCRMRGQPGDLNRVIPGSLIAIRADQSAPWTVTVVRRIRRLMVDHVDIGVEYLGRKPRFVKILTECADSSDTQVRDGAGRYFGALYLPASEEYPTIPLKTLLLPAREFEAGSTLILLSSNATYKLRLNEPLERQHGFVWTSFTLIDRQPAEMGSTTLRP